MGQLSWKRKLLFSFLTFLAFLVLAEVSLRVFDAIRGISAHSRALWFWGFEQDGFLDYRAKPNVVDIINKDGSQLLDTNSEGFRDVDIPIEPERERRLIICIGESSTWGGGSSDHNHTYPRFLQEELNRASTEPFVVMNAGIPGYTTVHNVQLLQLRLLKYKPEAILYMGFANDCWKYAASLENDTDLNRYPRSLAPIPEILVTRTLMRSQLFAFLVNRLLIAYNFQPYGTGIVTARGETLFRDQIALMKLLCERHGIKLIWVDQVINQSKATDKQNKLFESMRAILHDELRRQEIPLLQADDRFDHAAAPMPDEVHFTDAGYAQLAKILAPQLYDVLQADALTRPAGKGTSSGKESPRRP